MVYVNPVVRYVTVRVLSNGHGTASVGSRTSWSAAAFRLMIVNNHEKDLISLLETFKDTTESQ